MPPARRVNLDQLFFTPFHFENAHSGAFSSVKSNGSMRIFDAQRCKTREPRFKRHPSGGATVGLKLRKKPAPNPSLIGGFKPPCGGKWGFTGARPPWRAKKYKRGLTGLCPRVEQKQIPKGGAPFGRGFTPAKSDFARFF